MRGTNAWIPCTTPIRSRHRSTPSRWAWSPRPARKGAPTPALLHRTWQAPQVANTRVGERLHGFALRDVGDHVEHLRTARAQLARGLFERPRLDVGDHELHALVRKRPGQARGRCRSRRPSPTATRPLNSCTAITARALRPTRRRSAGAGSAASLLGTLRSTRPLLCVVPSSYSNRVSLRTGTSATGSSGDSPSVSAPSICHDPCASGSQLSRISSGSKSKCFCCSHDGNILKQ